MPKMHTSMALAPTGGGEIIYCSPVTRKSPHYGGTKVGAVDDRRGSSRIDDVFNSPRVWRNQSSTQCTCMSIDGPFCPPVHVHPVNHTRRDCLCEEGESDQIPCCQGPRFPRCLRQTLVLRSPSHARMQDSDHRVILDDAWPFPPSTSHTRPLFEVWGRHGELYCKRKEATPLVYDRHFFTRNWRPSLVRTGPVPCNGPLLRLGHAPAGPIPLSPSNSPSNRRFSAASQAPVPRRPGAPCTFRPRPTRMHTPLLDQRLGTSTASELLTSRPLHTTSEDTLRVVNPYASQA